MQYGYPVTNRGLWIGLREISPQTAKFSVKRVINPSITQPISLGSLFTLGSTAIWCCLCISSCRSLPYFCIDLTIGSLFGIFHSNFSSQRCGPMWALASNEDYGVEAS